MTPLCVFVVGEFWERALVARTRCSLASDGIRADQYKFKFGIDSQPLNYNEVLARVLKLVGPNRFAVIIPAGFIAKRGFRTELGRRLAERMNRGAKHWKPGTLINAPRSLMLLRGIGSEQLRFTFMPIDRPALVRLTKFRPRYRLQWRPARPSDPRPTKQVFSIYEGKGTFQKLKALIPQPTRLESRLRVLSSSALKAIQPGWVYRCNNEHVTVCLEHVRDRESIIAVGSGIKPWYLAAELSGSIKRLIIVDASLPQLRFAFDVFRSIEIVSSWTQILHLPGYVSDQDDGLCPSHNLIFDRIRKTRNRWSFDIIYVHCDIINQTFRLIELLRKLNVSRPLFWYSNVFQPYIAKDRSEHHIGLEHSFVNLLRSKFPDIALYDSGYMPIDDTRRRDWPAEIKSPLPFFASWLR